MTVECEDLFGAGINDDPVSADMQSFMPLRTWVGLKLMNDPDRDLNELLDTFCRGYYGSAAKPMRELLELIETRQAALPTRVVDVQRHEWLTQFCDTAFFESAYRLLDEATRSMDFQSVRNSTNQKKSEKQDGTGGKSEIKDSTGWKPMLRGFGDFCYRPDLRSGPGFWEVLDDGRAKDSKPFAQDKVRRGEKGLAMQVTRAADGSANLSVRHHSRHDRRNYPFPGDTAICSGTCELNFWLHRADAKSALVVYLSDDVDAKHAHEVGLYIQPGELGAILFRDGGKYVPSTATVPVGEWVKLTIRVDLERRTYAAEVSSMGFQPVLNSSTPKATTKKKDGTDWKSMLRPTLICRDVKYGSEFNAFNKIEFSPQGETGSVFYLDDVSWRWTPSVMFEAPGLKVLARDSFETAPLSRNWSLSNPSDISVDSDISFGPEYCSLRLRGAGGRATLTGTELKWSDSERLLLDIDVLPKSDLHWLQIAPSDQTRGSDDIGISVLAEGSQQPLFDLRTRGGNWQHGCGGKLMNAIGMESQSTSVAFDAWHRFQISLEPRSKTYRVLMQVLGEPPRELCRGMLEKLPQPATTLRLELSCLRQKARSDGPAFDNLQVTGSLSE